MESGVHEILDGSDCDLLEIVRKTWIKEGGEASPPAEVECVNLSWTRRGDRVVNQLARKLDGHRWRRNRHFWWIEDKRRVITTEVDGVISRTTDDGGGEGLIRAEDVDVISTTSAVDLKTLDATEVHEAARSCDHTLGHHEGVGNRSPHHDEGINARSPVDRDGAVFEVRITVPASSSEDIREVSNLFVIIRVLAEDEEGLEKKTIITSSTVEIDLRTVEVHLEGIIFAATEYVELVGGSISEILSVSDWDSLGEFQGSVSSVRNERHSAHDDLVITVSSVDESHGSGVIGKNDIITRSELNLNEFDASEEEKISLGAVTCVEPEESGTALPCSEGRAGNGVRFGGSENLDLIATLSSSGIGDGDASTVLTSQSHGVKFGQRSVVTLGRIRSIDRDFHREPTDGEFGRADGRHASRAADGNDGPGSPTSDDCSLKNPLKVFRDCPVVEAGEAVWNSESRINALAGLIELNLSRQSTDRATGLQGAFTLFEKEDVVRTIRGDFEGDEVAVRADDFVIGIPQRDILDIDSSNIDLTTKRIQG